MDQEIVAVFVVVVLGFLIMCVGYVASTTSRTAIPYRLSSGTVVNCHFRYQTECGLTLRDCDDGQSYSCQTNVTEGLAR